MQNRIHLRSPDKWEEHLAAGMHKLAWIDPHFGGRNNNHKDWRHWILKRYPKMNWDMVGLAIP